MKGLSSVPLVAAEILHGRVRNDKPALSEPRPRRSLRSVACEEDGMLSLVTAVTLLAFVFFISLIGNAGRSVKDKIEVQNASDAVAHSSALWMARGMNAITATNHLLGELTAIAVLHEAIKGPSDQKLKKTSEMETINKIIKKAKTSASAKWDEELVDEVARTLTSDNGKPSAGAMLYDSRMELKCLCGLTLAMKIIANALYYSGYGTAAGIALHIAGDVVLVKILVEWEMLAFLEIVAEGLKFPIENILEEKLIPQIAAYPDEMMGKSKGGSSWGGAVPLNQAIAEVAEQLSQKNGVDSTVFPSPVMSFGSRLELPVVPEAAPRGGSGVPQITPDDYRVPGDVMRQLLDTFEQVISIIKPLLDWLSDLNDWVNSLLPTQFIPDDIKKIINTLEELSGGFNNGMSTISAVTELSGELLHAAKRTGYKDNPSLAYLEKMGIDWEHEEKSQWVRATYPYVDKFRLPLAGAMNDPLTGMQLSNSATWYIMWTSRLTLSKSVEYRQDSGQALHMYVMKGMDRKKKGRESWTEDSKEAEDLFTLMAFAHREVRTIVAQSSFGDPVPKDLVTYTQSMFYNENVQAPGTGPPAQQPKVGWDTLNWDPKQGANEFDTTTRPSSFGSPLWKGVAFLRNPDSPKVKLNWQAKLVPVTQRRLSQAAMSPELPQRESVQSAILFTGQLDTH